MAYFCESLYPKISHRYQKEWTLCRNKFTLFSLVLWLLSIRNNCINTIISLYGLYHKSYSANEHQFELPNINDLGISMGFQVDYMNYNSFAVSLQLGKRYTELVEFNN